MDARWRIDMLGELRVYQQDREITRFQTIKTGALLAHLAYYLHRAHPREELIALLWPDSTLEQGRPSLSVALSSLRHQLEPPGIYAGAVLMANRATVQLNPEACTTDVALFEAKMRAANQAQSGAERIQQLMDAAEIYRGELLPGYYEDWCLAERQRLADIYCQILRDLVRLLAKSGDFARAIDYGRRAVNTDPLREELHSDLMRLYVAASQPSAALRQFRDLERILREEFDSPPSDAVRRMAQEIATRMAQKREVGIAETRAAAPAAPSRPTSATSSACPTGTVTLLLTGIQDAQKHRSRVGAAFEGRLADHHNLLRCLFEQHGGWEAQTASDACTVFFGRASDALACAVAIQRALAADERSLDGEAFRVRMMLHTGEIGTAGQPFRPERGLHSPAVKRAERALSAAHGGQILCSEETAVLLQRYVEPGLRLVDLGLYRLRDGEGSERLFEVYYPDRPQAAFPPPVAPPAPAGSLPLQFTRFVGREKELAQLLALLQVQVSPSARLVTLTGPGGTGKTRLAVEAAGRLRDAYRGAIWFVALADVIEPESIPEAVVDAFKLPASPDEDPLDRVLETLSGQPALLLLDNFEQMLTGEKAQPDRAALLIQTMLERLPALKCLITSRRRLDLTGELEFTVSPLVIPSGAARPEHLVKFDSVRLFVNRAQVVRPDFQVTEANALAISELCKRLEGIPLALELAAARSQVLTPAQMLARLTDRFELLAGNRKDSAPRHRTLRAALDWSYELLAPSLQRFFALLSVFRGGWSLQAAEEVCEEPLALDYLAQLRECSLVMTEDTPDNAGEIRFRMLETLREYSRDRLFDIGEAQRVQERHQDWFFQLALESDAASHPKETIRLKRLELEHENLLSALEWQIANDAIEKAARMCYALWYFWEKRGKLREGRDVMLRCLQRQHEIPDVSCRADLLLMAGWFAHLLADYEQAITLQQDSLALYQELGDAVGEATALNNLAVAFQDLGRLAEAREMYERSLSICRLRGDRAEQAKCLGNLGRLEIQEGQYVEARQRLEEARELFVNLHDVQGTAGCLCNLADLALNRQDWAEAQSLAEQSLLLFRQLDDRRGIAITLANLAEVATQRADHARAQTYIQEALAICEETGMRWLIPHLPGYHNIAP